MAGPVGKPEKKASWVIRDFSHKAARVADESWSGIKILLKSLGRGQGGAR